MQYKNIVVIATLCLLPVTILTRTDSHFGNTGIIGTVYDYSRNVIPNVLIVIENRATGKTQVTKSNLAGEYNLAVEPGKYSIRIPPTVNMPLGYERASFTASVGRTVIVNCYPYLAGTLSGFSNERFTTEYANVLPQVTTCFLTEPKRTVVQDFKLQYIEAVQNADITKYSLVVFTADQVTILAKAAYYRKGEANITFQGNVLYEKGEELNKAEKVKINIIAGTVVPE